MIAARPCRHCGDELTVADVRSAMALLCCVGCGAAQTSVVPGVSSFPQQACGKLRLNPSDRPEILALDPTTQEIAQL